MKKELKLTALASSKGTYNLCRCHFKYDINYFYFYIFDVSNKFLLGLEEDDFITDGFQIRKISDLTKIELRDDACVEINKQNRLLDGVKTPNVNINSWYDVFKSLKEIDKITTTFKNEEELRLALINCYSLNSKNFDKTFTIFWNIYYT